MSNLRLKMRHSLPPELVQPAVLALALAEGVDPEALRKAQQPVDTAEPEIYLDATKNLVIREVRDFSKVVGAALLAWATERVIVKKQLSAFDSVALAEGLLLVRELWRLFLGIGPARFQVPDDLAKQWRKWGITEPNLSPRWWFGDTFRMGFVPDITDDDGMSDLDGRYDTEALDRGAQVYQELALARACGDMSAWGDARIAKLGQLWQQRIASLYLTWGDRVDAEWNGRETLSQAELRELGKHIVAASWKGIETDWFEVFTDKDAQAELRVVAQGAVRFAFGLGQLYYAQYQDLTHCRFELEPEACDDCRRLLLDDDGATHTFPVTQLITNLKATGGYQPRGRRNWVVLPTIHPHCRCRMVFFVEEPPRRTFRARL